MYHGFFVDDDINDETYIKALSSSALSFKLEKPEELTSVAASIFNASPDIVALDYRLDENYSECQAAQYRAGPLAQQLRDLATANVQQDFPIVLVSAEGKIRHDYNPDATTHDLFDNIYPKEHAFQYRSELIGLIEGYKTLKECWSQTNIISKLGHILNLPENESFAFDFEEL